mmetsp:Transcript_31314/g.58065  ORF Transcript_31314/g.58065 Transcript_31314/m.58065 type:complete len:93 (-) Transcript_31314:9-287(-)
MLGLRRSAKEDGEIGSGQFLFMFWFCAAMQHPIIEHSDMAASLSGNSWRVIITGALMVMVEMRYYARKILCRNLFARWMCWFGVGGRKEIAT